MSKRTLRILILISAVVGAVPVLFGSLARAQSAADPHDPNATTPINCIDCHTLHGTGALIARGSAQETLCIGCHNPTGSASSLDNDFALHVDPDGGSTAVDCGSCHDVHGAMTASGETVANKWLIRTDPDKYISGALSTLVYTSTTTYTKSTSPYNGVCQACHTGTDHYTNSTSSTHQSTADCTSCHAHGDGFAGSGCSGCHVSAQPTTDPTRRAVMAEFAYSGGTTHLTGSTIDDADCEVCHDQGNHKEGDVVLNVYESTSNVTLTGNPNTTSSQAILLESVCLSCHTNATNLTDTTPFSTTSTPVDIDTGWTTSSSHNSNSSPVVTCYGDGTFGCHQSGHGSKNPSSLATYDTAFTNNVSEDLCLGCHDSNGPSSINVDADFPSSVTWIPTGYGAGPDTRENINDRHDFEKSVQSTSGYVMQCSHCHDPHTASSSAPLKADPDPDDSHDPTATTVSGGKYFADSTAMTEWCLSCHDGSLPAGITQPSATADRMINIQSTLSDDAHGEGSGSATLKQDSSSTNYGYTDDMFLQCLDCHAPHTGERSNQNLFQAKDYVYGTGSTWGTTKIPSDRSSPNQYVYELTDTSDKTQVYNGYQWCNTCHTGSMGGKKANCFDCHYHGTRW